MPQQHRRRSELAELTDNTSNLNGAYWRGTRESVGHDVFPGVFIGSQRAAQNEDFLQSHGIVAVLDLTGRGVETPGVGCTWQHIELEDSRDFDLSPHLDKAVGFIADNVRRGPVLVHCALGRSRSAAVCLAYAMRQLGLSLDEAWAQMHERYPEARVNEGFWAQLQRCWKIK